jgi:hypothetical protein
MRTPNILLPVFLLCGCGGEQPQSASPVVISPAPTAAPTPSPAPAPFVALKFAYEAHRFSNRDVVPEYTYAGVVYSGGLAGIFPQGSISVDFQRDNYPEVVVPLNKAYGTPAYAAMPYLLLSNANGRLMYDAAHNAAMPSVFGARRAAVLSVGGKSAAFFVAHNVSGVYGDPKAHGSAILLGQRAGAVTTQLDVLPRITTKQGLPDNATDAHSMATGDINGDGLDDILIGNWNPWGGFPPTILLQTPSGQFAASSSNFTASLLSVPLTNPNSEGNENNNLLLDLHFVDVNGDKYADLIAGFGHGSTPSFLFINRNGQFSFEDRIALPPSVYGINTSLHMATKNADIDNDGDQDLVILYSRYVPYYGGNYIQILRNDGGKFTDTTETALPQDQSYIMAKRLEWSSDVFMRDLDKDGLVDILHGLNNGRLMVYFNKGAGQFTRLTTTLRNNAFGRLVAVDDFNADGKQELSYFEYTGGSSTENTFVLTVYELDFQKP